MVETWALSYSPKQEELEYLCLITVCQRNVNLWPRDIKVDVCDQRFFMDFNFVCGDARE